MSIDNVLRKLHKEHGIYVNRNPNDRHRLGQFGTLNGATFRSEGYLPAAFDRHNIQMPADMPDVPVLSPGAVYYHEGQVNGNITLARNSETRVGGTVELDGVSVDASDVRTFSGTLGITFSRANAFIFSYTNYYRQWHENSGRYSDVIEGLYRERGDAWKKKYVLLMERYVADSAQLIYATRKTGELTFDVSVTADSSFEYTEEPISLSAARNMGLTFTGGLSGSSTDVASIPGGQSCVPVMKFFKLKGVGRNLNLESVK